jgi:hypothetical protein
VGASHGNLPHVGITGDQVTLNANRYPSNTPINRISMGGSHITPLGEFWKIVALKLIELATCGLRQIIVKLWNLFFIWTDGISGHLYDSQSVVSEMATFFKSRQSTWTPTWTWCNCTQYLSRHALTCRPQWGGAPSCSRMDISRNMYRQRRSNVLASMFTRRNTAGFFPVGLCQEQFIPNTS